MSSAGAFFRASVRRELGMPPAWLGAAQGVTGSVTLEEIQANAGDEAMVVAIAEAIVEPVSRAAAGRSAAATSEPMDVTAGETAPVRLAREFGLVKASPKPDYSRFVEAAKAKPLPAPVAPVRPTQVALSPEECKRCGIPGWKGCDHQLPYEAWTPADQRADPDKYAGHREQKHRRTGGIQSVRI
ncbi:hypothetical protein [Novosphingobium sp.]|uniref:hypothetical protein n=1 Tax=Novosphingobium sp. TaxID=1874826 RepID=UPI00286E40C3|nr:hypothetical protein [Novosphingobium sp.]